MLLINAIVTGVGATLAPRWAELITFVGITASGVAGLLIVEARPVQQYDRGDYGGGYGGGGPRPGSLPDDEPFDPMAPR
jgi:hypothetical protein